MKTRKLHRLGRDRPVGSVKHHRWANAQYIACLSPDFRGRKHWSPTSRRQRKERRIRPVEAAGQIERNEAAARHRKNYSEASPKFRLAALILCLLFGGLGVHRFYVGQIQTGCVMLLIVFFAFLLGGLGVSAVVFPLVVLGLWVMMDLMIIIAGSFMDGDGRRVLRWTDPGSE